jgi:dipeptidase D
VAVDTSVLAGVEPRAFWRHFETLTTIARPPRHEEAGIEHVRGWAAEHGFDVEQDHARNLVVRVPATPGRESAPTVVLQGHLDMVCERHPDSPNDAAEGRIELARDGDWLTANGTTLGADNGVAIAAMMALAEGESLPHGPLELLMTVAEEVGLEGANELDPALVTGSILLNLDSGPDTRLTVGCAGSTDTWIHIDGRREDAHPSSAAFVVTASGGLGGHSGVGIARGRANAIKVLGRALREVHASAPFRLVSLSGGKSRNAIPRDAAAVVSVALGRETDLRAALETATASIRDTFSKTDPDVAITLEAADASDRPWTEEATRALLDAVVLVPTGPLAMSSDFAGLVETSTSLGEATTDGDRLTLHSLSRSSNDAALSDVIASLEALARLAGGRLEIKRNYGGWRPNLDSPALVTSSAVYERLFGDKPGVTAVHGGLEPAVIGDKIPGLDMLSFGPQIEDPHSPDERVSIPSVERFWKLLVALADDLSDPARGAA